MDRQKIKYAYRLPPCPQYDIAGTESWLEDMASNGYILSKDGFFMGMCIFEKRVPQKLRYRLTPAKKGGDEPELEERDIYSNSGWEFVTGRGSFNIYCTGDIQAPEIDTDACVHALALNIVRKKERSNLFTLIFWLLVYPVVILRSPVTMLLTSNLSWLMVLLLLILIICSAVRAVKLRRLARALAEGQPMEHKKEWKKTAPRFIAGKIAFLAFVVFFFCYAFTSCAAEGSGENEKDLQSYMGQYELPFADMSDFAPGEFVFDDIGISNTVETGSSLASPSIIDMHQYGEIILNDGTVISGGLTVNYMKSRSAVMAGLAARALARDISREGRSWFGKKNEKMQLPELDVDYAAAYYDVFPTVVMQKGCEVVRVCFYQTSDNNIPDEQWLSAVAESLKG